MASESKCESVVAFRRENIRLRGTSILVLIVAVFQLLDFPFHPHCLGKKGKTFSVCLQNFGDNYLRVHYDPYCISKIYKVFLT